MYTDDQLLPISAVSHYVHCPRRCALIHLEQVWAENTITAEGVVLHEKAHSDTCESRRDLRILRGLRLRSFELGITGVADIVELHRDISDAAGAVIPGLNGRWTSFPIEYKRGASKNIRCYEVQLCAQALCLEEMLNTHIPQGALFLGVKHHRVDVSFNESLRHETKLVCNAAHTLFDSGLTPSAEYSKRCDSCSLIDLCQPRTVGAGKKARVWIDRQIKETLTGDSE